MIPCIYHDRLDFTTVNLFTFPVRSKIILPCCNSPKDAALRFRHEFFMRGGKFDFKAYSEHLYGACNSDTCPNYRPGRQPIKEIALGEWRKCPGRCISCPNHIRHAPERALTDAELLQYMEDISGAYAEASRENDAVGAPPPALLIGTAGDLFFSENYRGILHMDLGALGFKEISLITSLQTWSPGNPLGIHPNTKALIRTIIISMDGATPEVYEHVREGSSWEKLLKGYEVASALFPYADYKLSVTVSKINMMDVLALPERIPGLFPKISTIEYHAVADWIGTPGSRDLLLSPDEKEYLKDWCTANPRRNGIGVKFLY